MSVLSLEDLPYDANGGLPGKWLVQLRDEINSFHAGSRFELGRSIEPITGHVLRRFIAASLKVRGAVRVEGEPIAVGDVSTLLEPARAMGVVLPEPPPEEPRAPERPPVTPALPEKPLEVAPAVIEPSTAPIEPVPAAEAVVPAAPILPPPEPRQPETPNANKIKKERR